MLNMSNKSITNKYHKYVSQNYKLVKIIEMRKATDKYRLDMVEMDKETNTETVLWSGWDYLSLSSKDVESFKLYDDPKKKYFIYNVMFGGTKADDSIRHTACYIVFFTETTYFNEPVRWEVYEMYKLSLPLSHYKYKELNQERIKKVRELSTQVDKALKDI